MKQKTLVFVFMFIHFLTSAQNKNVYPKTDPQFIKDIDSYILHEKNKENKALLQKFRKKYNDSTSQISVQKENNREYEIWVDHQSNDGYSWAEGYTLNKKSGKTEMIWHEHPMKTEPILLEKIKPDTINTKEKKEMPKKLYKCRKPMLKEN